MTLRSLAVAALAALTVAPAASAHEPTLKGRAILPADASAPAPFPGVINTDPAPAPGSRQPIGGFSALLDAPGKDTFYAMPDNGFGSKANSRSFILRVYRVKADFRRGSVKVLDWISLRDPNGKIKFPLVSPDRTLTGGDFDIESFRIARDGTLWFGDEFGPFLIHTDRTGKVLEAPIPLPGVQSPDNPAGGTPNLASSNGFEGMALSKDGRKLYPALEGPVTGDDATMRRLYAFDLKAKRYEPGYRTLHLESSTYLVSDLVALDDSRLLQLERDNTQGAATIHKQGFVVNLERKRWDGAQARRPVFDLTDLRDPFGISEDGARPGDIGLGDPFAMPYQTIEAVQPLGGDKLAIVNDTNFGSRGRNPNLDDYSDFVEIEVPGLRGR